MKAQRRVAISLLTCGALAPMAGLAPGAAAHAEPTLRPTHRSGACHRLAGRDRAPAPSVKVVSTSTGLYGCVFPHGPVRQIASADDSESHDAGFRLRAVAGAVVLFDQDFNNAYIRAHRTVVYDLHRARPYAVAAEESGDASSASATFRAPVAFIDARGCAVAALVSTDASAPGVRITRFGPAGSSTLLDQDSPAQLPPSSLIRNGSAVRWQHAGVTRTVALC